MFKQIVKRAFIPDSIHQSECCNSQLLKFILKNMQHNSNILFAPTMQFLFQGNHISDYIQITSLLDTCLLLAFLT